MKYEGIGPVDESGMPIAPRSVSPGLGVTDSEGPETPPPSSISMSRIGLRREGPCPHLMYLSQALHGADLKTGKLQP